MSDGHVACLGAVKPPTLWLKKKPPTLPFLCRAKTDASGHGLTAELVFKM
jgi:hypothetical protein